MSNDETICINCGNKFNSKLNRKIKESHRHSIFNILFPMMPAFEEFYNFNLVTCPQCTHEYRIENVKLFGMFKSPNTVIFLIILINIIVIFLAIISIK